MQNRYVTNEENSGRLGVITVPLSLVDGRATITEYGTRHQVRR